VRGKSTNVLPRALVLDVSPILAALITHTVATTNAPLGPFSHLLTNCTIPIFRRGLT
jgi:hypothetical protein